LGGRNEKSASNENEKNTVWRGKGSLTTGGEKRKGGRKKNVEGFGVEVLYAWLERDI